MNPTTVGIWNFAPIQVFNAMNKSVKFVAHLEFTETTPQIKGTIALLKLAKLAEKKKWKGPTDLASNHDKYFYEAWKRER